MKHGTCATGISSMETEREFFSTVLSLHEQQMNFTKMLTDNDIFPSYDNTYWVLHINCNYTSNFCYVPVLLDDKTNSYAIIISGQ